MVSWRSKGLKGVQSGSLVVVHAVNCFSSGKNGFPVCSSVLLRPVRETINKLLRKQRLKNVGETLKKTAPEEKQNAKQNGGGGGRGKKTR